MAKVLTVSRYFPAYHERKGEPTNFIESIHNSLNLNKADSWIVQSLCTQKHHTIRGGNRWRVGDKASLRYWTGKPCNSLQQEFALVDIVQVMEIAFIPIDEVLIIDGISYSYSNSFKGTVEKLAANDGLSYEDLMNWFGNKGIIGQIICWNKVSY